MAAAITTTKIAQLGNSTIMNGNITVSYTVTSAQLATEAFGEYEYGLPSAWETAFAIIAGILVIVLFVIIWIVHTYCCKFESQRKGTSVSPDDTNDDGSKIDDSSSIKVQRGVTLRPYESHGLAAYMSSSLSASGYSEKIDYISLLDGKALAQFEKQYFAARESAQETKDNSTDLRGDKNKTDNTAAATLETPDEKAKIYDASNQTTTIVSTNSMGKQDISNQKAEQNDVSNQVAASEVSESAARTSEPKEAVQPEVTKAVTKHKHKHKRRTSKVTPLAEVSFGLCLLLYGMSSLFYAANPPHLPLLLLTA